MISGFQTVVRGPSADVSVVFFKTLFLVKLCFFK